MSSAPGLHTIQDGETEAWSMMIVLVPNPGAPTISSTWTHPTTGVFWPRDLLHQHTFLKKVPIHAFQYSAPAASFQDEATITEEAQALADAVDARLGTTNNVVFITHGLGGLVAQKALLLARNARKGKPQWRLCGTGSGGVKTFGDTDVNFIFLGTPYLGVPVPDEGDSGTQEPAEENPVAGEEAEKKQEKEKQAEEEEQLALVKRFGATVFGEEPRDPVATLTSWRSISTEVVQHHTGWSSSLIVKAAAFREAAGSGEVLVEEKYSKFAGRECLNYHPNNVGLVRAHGYLVDESVPGFEIQAAHADLGRFPDPDDPAYTSIVKILAVYEYHGGVDYNISLQGDDDWFG